MSAGGGSRTVSAMIGTASASFRVSVMMLAVAERSGLSPGGGRSSVTRTSKSTACAAVCSPLVEVLAVVEDRAILVTRPAKVVSG